jgi:hypothetical protein
MRISDCRSLVRRILSAGVLAASLASPPVARGGEPADGTKAVHVKTVEILAGRELTLWPAEATVYEARIPVRVVPPDAIGGAKFHTLAVSREGQMLDNRLVDIQVEDKGEVPRLLLKAKLAGLQAAGAYTVKVQPGPGDPAAAPPLLEFILTRPAAELRLIAPIKLERTVVFPCCSWWRPNGAVLAEASGKSYLKPAGRNWISELRGDGGIAAGRIELELPEMIGPGGQGEISVRTIEAPALGKSTGTLVVRSPQLAAQVFETAIEVTSRVHGLWLFVTVGIGIAVGYQVRTRYEQRLRDQQARVFAAERLQSLETAISTAEDPPLQRDLKATRQRLLEVWERSTVTPDELENAAKAAETQLAERLQRFSAEEAEIRTAIKNERTELGPPTRQPDDIVAILGDADKQLREIGIAVDQGRLEDAHQLLDNFRVTVQRNVMNSLTDARRQFANIVQNFGTWAETPLQEAAQGIDAKLGELQQKGDKKIILQSFPQIIADFRSRVFGTAVDAILRQASKIEAGLRTTNAPALTSPLDALGQAIRAVSEAQSSADYDSLPNCIQNLGNAIIGALRAAPRSESDQERFFEAIANGRFQTAFNDLAQHLPVDPGRERRLGEGEEGGALEAIAITPQPQFAEVHVPVPLSWEIAIEPPTVAVAGRPILLRFQVLSSTPPVPELSRIRWYVNDLPAETDPASREFTLQDSQPGPSTIRVRAETAGGDWREARLKLLVAPPEEAMALPDLVKKLKDTEMKSTVLSGALIAVLGYLLYRNQFVGDAADFAAAFFWGFSTDIGFAKVRELSTPLSGRISKPATAPAGAPAAQPAAAPAAH